MKRTQILILCIGGQGASVLSRTFHACGMSYGNENTYWEPHFEIPHGEHSLITAAMAGFNVVAPTREQCSAVIEKVKDILFSYKLEAEKQDWKCYGIKTTSGICANKWSLGVSRMFREEWPDALYYGVIRQPDFGYYNKEGFDKGWSNVWAARKEIVDRGGVFVPFPEAWLDKSIQKVVESAGLVWDEEALSIFQESAEEKVWSCSEEEKEEYFSINPLEKEQREYLMNKSNENLNNLLKGRKHSEETKRKISLAHKNKTQKEKQKL